jgi:hypothetical protein
MHCNVSDIASCTCLKKSVSSAWIWYLCMNHGLHVDVLVVHSRVHLYLYVSGHTMHHSFHVSMLQASVKVRTSWDSRLRTWPLCLVCYVPVTIKLHWYIILMCIMLQEWLKRIHFICTQVCTCLSSWQAWAASGVFPFFSTRVFFSVPTVQVDTLILQPLLTDCPDIVEGRASYQQLFQRSGSAKTVRSFPPEKIVFFSFKFGSADLDVRIRNAPYAKFQLGRFQLIRFWFKESSVLPKLRDKEIETCASVWWVRPKGRQSDRTRHHRRNSLQRSVMLAHEPWLHGKFAPLSRNRLYHELAKVVRSAEKIFELLYLKNFVDS